MNKSMSKLLERVALVTFASGISSSIVLYKLGGAANTETSIRAERLEIVDSNGFPCVVLEGGDRGGSLTISSPRRGQGKKGIFAYIGSTFGNDMTAFFREPKPESKTAISLFIGGEPSYPKISGTGGGGHPYFGLGGIGSEKPMFKLWHLHEEEPYFSK